MNICINSTRDNYLFKSDFQFYVIFLKSSCVEITFSKKLNYLKINLAALQPASVQIKTIERDLDFFLFSKTTSIIITNMTFQANFFIALLSAFNSKYQKINVSNTNINFLSFRQFLLLLNFQQILLFLQDVYSISGFTKIYFLHVAN